MLFRSGTAYGYLWVDCDKKDVASVEQSLNTLISNTSHIKMDTYHAQLQYAEYTSRMMKHLLIWILSFLVVTVMGGRKYFISIVKAISISVNLLI